MRANYFRDLPLHHSQEEIKRTDEYSVFKYCIVPTPDFVEEILSNGDAVVVMKPKWLADEIIQIADNIINNYK